MEENIGKIEGMLEGMKESQDKILKRLDGNGQPGLSERMTRNEDNLAKLAHLLEDHVQTSLDFKEEEKQTVDNLLGATNDLRSALGELTDLVKDHIKDDKKHTAKGILLNKDVILYMVLALVFIHSILPDDLKLFEIVRNLLGF